MPREAIHKSEHAATRKEIRKQVNEVDNARQHTVNRRTAVFDHLHQLLSGHYLFFETRVQRQRAGREGGGERTDEDVQRGRICFN